MKVITKLFIIIGAIILLVECDNTPTSVEDNKTFSISITIKSANSEPVKNTSVSVWPKRNIYHLPKQNKLSEVQALTTFRYSVAQNSYIDLSLFDLEGELVAKLIDMEKQQSGIYEYSYSNKTSSGTNVLKCKLQLYEDSLSNSLIFQDSIYSSIVHIDPVRLQVGSTNTNGTIIIKDKLLFPGLYNLPIMPWTIGPLESIGGFSFSNCIGIVIGGKYFEKQIIDGENIFNLVWEEGLPEIPILNVSNNEIRQLKTANNRYSTKNVNLSYFKANREENGIKLTWATSEETNNYGFEIYRKIDSDEWNIIGFIAGNGNSTKVIDYAFFDNTSALGIINYRLRQIDNDGSINLLDSISVNYFVGENKLYQNYPNPFN